MLEWLAASTGVELGKLVLEQTLDLGKPVLEEYVQDFFKDCLNNGVAQINSAALKTPMAEAVGYFVKRFIKELQLNEIPETSIQHHYNTAIKKFVQDKTVRPILGKAFERDCKKIDYLQLERIWMQQYKVSGWQFPDEEFDWKAISKEYVYEVKGIVKTNTELRSLLDTQLLEDIARNTARLAENISPGFDIETYRESLQSSYSYLRLYTLDSTNSTDTIKLRKIFTQQTVREALPTTRYELPLDLRRKLQEAGQPSNDLSQEFLENHHREYFQKPERAILEAAMGSQRTVILGDPGAGKSSFLQYLALDWVEGNTETLPLLIELKEFSVSPSTNFLDFLHQSRGVGWQFDQQELHQHLLKTQALVMFDGLDEVFDRATQSTVIDAVIRFSQKYQKAQVIVTSRIIGYNPERLDHSGFCHFTIQPLDKKAIHKFIDRWYDLSMGDDPNRKRLKKRLKDAISQSKAIQNLSDNPLLLTMMSILNRRQELPRDRADLYDQASRVLLYHWDVDHKRLCLPVDILGRREKAEMLMMVAYEMQAGEDGLKGNLISAEGLTYVLTNYLRNQGFSESREKSNRLIQQLRERNFILCYRGADTYSFMHRTFLEYFCAVEIVHRFEKQHILTFEQLRDEVFGKHWDDETWHEVLQLICGMIDSQFASKLIEFVLSQSIDQRLFLDEGLSKKRGEHRLRKEGLTNVFLAVECFKEIRTPTPSTANQLLKRLKQELQDRADIKLDWETAAFVCRAIACHFRHDLDVLSWLKQRAKNDIDFGVRRASVTTVSYYFRNDPEVFSWLQERFNQDDTSWVRRAIVEAVASEFSDRQELLPWLVHCFQKEEVPAVLQAIVKVIAENFDVDFEILLLLERRIIQDENYVVRDTLIRSVSKYFNQEAQISDLLYEVAQNDPCIPSESWRENCRKTALTALLNDYPISAKTLDFLRDRIIHDPDEHLREWARQQLDQYGKTT